jgi:hypothetical protein
LSLTSALIWQIFCLSDSACWNLRGKQFIMSLPQKLELAPPWHPSLCSADSCTCNHVLCVVRNCALWGSRSGSLTLVLLRSFGQGLEIIIECIAELWIS